MRHECALFEELNFVWREAQAEANLAYEAWRRSPWLEVYAVYRAAQDQADAAQDDLAVCWQQLAASALDSVEPFGPLDRRARTIEQPPRDLRIRCRPVP
jgi:hypothetical protein